MRAKIKGFLMVVLGTVLMAVSLNVFLIPNDLAPGGVSGLSVVINHLLGVPVGLLLLILNIPIFVLGFRHFKKSFMVFSLIGMILLSGFIDLFVFLPKVTEDMLLSSVYGGALLGVGVGLVFVAGSTTGGADLVAKMFRKKFPFISLGRFVLLIDVVVVSLAGVVFGNWEVVLYSFIAIYISTIIIDLIAEGGSSAKVAYVISDKQREVAECISSELERGTTLLHGSSVYSGNEKTVLLCVVRKYEIPRLKSIIKEVDASAFVIFSDAREVLGKGFGSH